MHQDTAPHTPAPIAALTTRASLMCPGLCSWDCPAAGLEIFSYGMGADSTAILVRWLTDPSSRPFSLDRLVVIIAQTGDEWEVTGQLVEDYVFPLLAAHGVRTIQVARAGASEADGIAILDDTTHPTRCHIWGAYRLSDELAAAGTIPTTGGARLCSVKSKGWVLDQLIAMITGGHAYHHCIGFEVDELSRIRKDKKEGGAARLPWYPLADWGWNRDRCETEILSAFGVAWPKSACVQCPYALTSKDGRARTLPRLIANPEQAFKALLLEHTAVALNPRMGLIAGELLADALADVEGGPELLATFDAYLDTLPHALYEVRRVFRARKDDPSKAGNAVRSIRILRQGTRAEMRDLMTRASQRYDRPVDVEGGAARIWAIRKDDTYPCREHLMAMAPAGVVAKDGPGFRSAWEALDAAQKAPRPTAPAAPVDLPAAA